MNEVAQIPLTGDGPKRFISEDLFGFSRIAQTIAAVVTDRIASDGYAIGIEGKWGSGKSTLLYFVEEALRAQRDSYHKVLRFEPWLVGNKDSLLRSFFDSLVSRIEEFRSDAKVKDKIGSAGTTALDRIVVNINRYSDLLSASLKATESVKALDSSQFVKGTGWALKCLLALAKHFKKPEPSLETLKDKIVADLQVLANLLNGARIVVIVDDTDRLDPPESVEILRLVRAVANFPFVTYLIAFNRTILSTQVVEVTKVPSGEEYLEKIFQQIITVPPQEPFALRRLVQRKLEPLLAQELDSTPLDESNRADRLDSLFGKWVGSLITTPRDAIRLCDAVNLGWPYLRGRGDLLDFIWLQLLKLKSKALYEWVQEYTVNLGSYRDGGRAGDNEPNRMALDLITILGALGFSTYPDRSDISLFLPGVKTFGSPDSRGIVFNFKSSTELKSFEQQRRLGSPSHWRFYFAFDKPSYAIGDEELQGFAHKCETDWKQALIVFNDTIAGDRDQKTHAVDVLVTRVRDLVPKLSATQAQSLARIYCEAMDRVPRSPHAQFGGDDPWTDAANSLAPIVSDIFPDLMAQASSIVWMGFVLRDQGFALAKIGKGRVGRDSWLSSDQFDKAKEQFLIRFYALSFADAVGKAEAVLMFVAWGLLESRERVSDWVNEFTKDDKSLLQFLAALRTWSIHSSKGLQRVLNESLVKLFMDGKEAYRRLETLRSGDYNNPGLADELHGQWSHEPPAR